MAQQSVLRVHADRRQRRTVVFHPMCHLDRHEGQAYQRLHGLSGRPAADLNRLVTIEDLTAIGELPAALLIELPQRDLGGQQPAWEDLQAQVGWAHDRGAAAHLDGARLWESAAGYGRPPAEIAALFDTVYVSFYKGIGALAGCCVAGPADILAEVREWRRRMGGACACGRCCCVASADRSSARCAVFRGNRRGAGRLSAADHPGWQDAARGWRRVRRRAATGSAGF